MSATAAGPGGTADAPARRLPAGSVKGLAVPRAEVKAVHQPYSTWGETPKAPGPFAVRVGERLRHRDRASTCWDYKHLVLEAFPEIYKAKCLPVGSSDNPAEADLVRVLVIPDIRGKRPFNPFEPKVSTATLERIKHHLRARTSPLVRLSVRNPRYVPLEVRMGVRFSRDYRPGLHEHLLDLAVSSGSSPRGPSTRGARSPSADGSTAPRDRLRGTSAVRGLCGGDGSCSSAATAATSNGPPAKADSPGAAVDNPAAILVSASHHVIDAIAEPGYVDEHYIGIGYMRIELDFRLA